MTRETKKSTSVSESIFKGTNVVNDERNDIFLELDQLQDLLETRDSDITKEEDLSFGLSSKYVIKLIKPQASIDLNLPSLVEEHP
jgi:hypothetical protein